MNDEIVPAIQRQLQGANRILIVSHVRPDGDAVGSLLGLGLALDSLGKDVQMVLDDGVPSGFHYLEGSERIKNHADGEFDLIITVDCSDLERVGDALLRVRRSDGEDGGIPDINIDHHITNLNFARYNLVETEAAATSEIIANHLSDFGLPLSQQVASALLTGIITDTLGFRTHNMMPPVLYTVAKLMEAGADLPTLFSNALYKRSFLTARLWGLGLSKLKREGPIIWTSLTRKDRQSVGYPGRDDGDLINLVSSIDEAAVAMVFVEQNNGSVKVSLRAQPGIDVSKVALGFGGGGHKAAAGAQLEGTLDEVQEKVLRATRALLAEEQP
jgi:bifunctional oligoribonuclease and PAP phosphatase NrnA